MSEYPNYGQNAANAYNPNYGIAEQAQTVREASLRNKAEETEKYLCGAHDLMDQLEYAIHGPSPKLADPTSAPTPQEPGLRRTLDSTSQRAATLVSRLQTLLGAL